MIIIIMIIIIINTTTIITTTTTTTTTINNEEQEKERISEVDVETATQYLRPRCLYPNDKVVYTWSLQRRMYYVRTCLSAAAQENGTIKAFLP